MKISEDKVKRGEDKVKRGEDKVRGAALGDPYCM